MADRQGERAAVAGKRVAATNERNGYQLFISIDFPTCVYSRYDVHILQQDANF